MQERIDLVVVAEEPKKPGGLSLGLLVSVVLHSAFVVWFLLAPREVAPAAKQGPMLRYVELMKQNPREFTEAPGPEVKKAPLSAPFSDKNRKASMPEPTGPTPTTRPGDGRGLYTPAMPPPGPRGVQPQPQQLARQPQGANDAPSSLADANAGEQQPDDVFAYRERNDVTKASAAASGAIDWNSAIKAVKGSPGAGGAEGFDLGQAGSGGELGTADQGPLSFETQWYDWGPYAQSMVSRIRVNWYANMPTLIRTGIKGVVTIRFTIERDGRITAVTILKSSGHPPYDFAARKAIELSSPLAPLPKDFPNPSERVTAMFYYNTPLP